MRQGIGFVLIFLAATLVWWAIAGLVFMEAVMPCGLGPDDMCETSQISLLLAYSGAFVGYGGLAALLLRWRDAR